MNPGRSSAAGITAESMKDTDTRVEIKERRRLARAKRTRAEKRSEKAAGFDGFAVAAGDFNELPRCGRIPEI